jgi:hypothetical protein
MRQKPPLGVAYPAKNSRRTARGKYPLTIPALAFIAGGAASSGVTCARNFVLR